MSAVISRRGMVVSGLFAWLVGMPLVFGGLPWALSLITARHGWSDERPGPWNLMGLVPVGCGVALLAWVAVTGFAHAHEMPERASLDWTPKVFLRSGPYARSRNPMYVGERIVWFGWTIFYGSVILAVGLVLIAAGQSLLVLREERDLETRFGEAYLEYKRAVPRWLRAQP
jgi:protein-S-isoprenylcysteine O-methyltransferase Ste14